MSEGVALFHLLDNGDGEVTLEDLPGTYHVQAAVQPTFHCWQGCSTTEAVSHQFAPVNAQEFVDGILRCKGQARAIDQVAIHSVPGLGWWLCAHSRTTEFSVARPPAAPAFVYARCSPANVICLSFCPGSEAVGCQAYSDDPDIYGGLPILVEDGHAFVEKTRFSQVTRKSLGCIRNI